MQTLSVIICPFISLKHVQWVLMALQSIKLGAGQSVSPGPVPGRYLGLIGSGFGGELLLFSRSGVSDSLGPHGLQHTRPPCSSPSPGVCSNSCPLSRWCHPTISSSVTPFPPALNLSQHQGLFPMSWLSASGGQSTRASASASVLPMNIQGWFPLGWTGWISLMSKGLSRVFSRATVEKHHGVLKHLKANWHTQGQGPWRKPARAMTGNKDREGCGWAEITPWSESPVAGGRRWKRWGTGQVASST